MRPPSISYPVLLADIGGTNCRLSMVADPESPHHSVARIGTGSFATPEAAFESVIAELPERPRSAILAVAGPLDGRRAQLTNASWDFDGPRIAEALKFNQGLLVNDFEALADLGRFDVPSRVPQYAAVGLPVLALGCEASPSGFQSMLRVDDVPDALRELARLRADADAALRLSRQARAEVLAHFSARARARMLEALFSGRLDARAMLPHARATAYRLFPE